MKLLSCLIGVFLFVSLAKSQVCLPQSARTDCGYPGIQPSACTQLGCCWNTDVLGVPWCFHRTAVSADGEGSIGDSSRGVPAVVPQQAFVKTNAAVQFTGCLFRCTSVVRPYRTSCGNLPDELSCVNVGCCYDVNDPVTSRRCYHPAVLTGSCPTPRCQIPSASLRRCGFGLSQNECVGRGCCYHVVENGRQCYHSETPARPLSEIPATSPPTTTTTTTTTQAPTTTMSFLDQLRRANADPSQFSLVDLLTKDV
uniref:P-type domain-containing protein n=1 Tax=Ciona savignyi TaxID=51511 RepID=H2YP71_CIOSA